MATPRRAVAGSAICAAAMLVVGLVVQGAPAGSRAAFEASSGQLPGHPLLDKVSGRLREARQMALDGAGSGAIQAAIPLLRMQGDRHEVEVRLTRLTPDVRTRLEAAGLVVRSASERYAVATGLVAPAALEALAALPEVTVVRPLYRPRRRSGPVTSQGDTSIRAAQARGAFGVDGTGAKVGILSDSFAATLGDGTVSGSGCTRQLTGSTPQALDELPASVVVLDDCTAGSPACDDLVDEGRAIGEEIHDLAPGANLLFHSGFNSEADFADGITELRNCGADVLVDNVIYITEAMFQDGLPALAAQAAVDNGTVYLSAAGNEAGHGVDDVYFDSNAAADHGESGDTGFFGDDFHDFGGGTGDKFAAITLPPGCGVTLVLQWNDPFSGTLGPGATSDLDLYLYNTEGSGFLDLSLNAQGCGSLSGVPFGDPFEVVSFTNGTANPRTIFAAVDHSCGPETERLRIAAFSEGAGCNLADPGYAFEAGIFQDPQIFGHPAAADVLAVAPVLYQEIDSGGANDPPAGQIDVEPFSSLGGDLAFYFDGAGAPLPGAPVLRFKPDIAAPDGTNTSFFGADIPADADADPNHFGSSAAAAHAAALAALLRAGDPAATATFLNQALIATALDIESPGVDALSGSGLIDAVAALAAVLPVPDVDPPSVDFGSVGVSDPVTDVLTMSNQGTGSGDLVVSAMTLSDPVNFDLDVSAGGDPCGSTTRTLAPGDSCTFAVIFQPTASGVYSEELTIESNVPSVVVPLAGTSSDPGISLSKVADPSSLLEPGGAITFTVEVTNDSADTDPVDLTTLTDDVHGNLDGKGNCLLPQTIAPGGTYSCSFSANVSGNAGDSETDTVSASGNDDEGTPVGANDSATVTITDAPPTVAVTKSAAPASLAEPGGTVTFSVSVQNSSASSDPLTLATLTDDVYGDLTDPTDEGASAKPQLSTSCVLPQVVAAGASYNCTFTADVIGNAGFSETDTVTAAGTDDEGGAVSGGDGATVTVTGADPAIAVAKTAVPGSLSEPGGDVTFSVQVTNQSVSSDPVTIDTLVDSVHGDLDGQGDCAVPQTIQPGDAYGCSFQLTFADKNAGFSETDTVTASGVDDEEVSASSGDDATVSVTGASPAITVVKTAAPTTLAEPGGTVSFSVSITNDSVSTDPVTIDALVDSVYGDLAGQGDCVVPQLIQPGATYGCSFTAQVSGNAGDVEVDTVTASGADDDSTTVSGNDSATVSITGLEPALTVTKTASPTTVPEPVGTVTFTVRIDNVSVQADPVTISALTDSIHGSLAGQGDCALPQTIQPAEFYECSFDAQVAGNAGEFETDTVTASGEDDEGVAVSAADSATVTLVGTDPVILVTKTPVPASLPEPGGAVSFTVRIDNASNAQDPAEITALSDNVYGNIADSANPLLDSTTCALPQTIPPGGFYECVFGVSLSGDPGQVLADVVTAFGTDDDGSPVAVDAAAAVTLTDELPVVGVTKTPSASSVSEPGEEVSFTVVVTNDSVISDALTLDSLVDDLRGDVADATNPALVSTTCAVPQTIDPGQSYSCQFTAFVGGNAGDSESDTVTASCRDDEGNTVNAAGLAVVDVDDAAAVLTVVKTAVPTSRPAPGGSFSFTVEVLNASGVTDPVTLNSLTDDVHGDLDGLGSCLMPQSLDAGSSYTCSFQASFVAAEGDSETDTVTAQGVDDEGSAVAGQASATITLTDAQPVLTVVKTAAPASVPEPGGQVAFTVEVTNDSVAEDPVTLTALVDDVHGSLDGQGDCSVPQLLAPGATYSCSFSAQISGNAGDAETDRVTVTAEDDEANVVNVSDTATVTIAGVEPSVTVLKTASPSLVPEPSGPVTFTVRVDNVSVDADPVTILDLVDTVYGDLTILTDEDGTAKPQTGTSCVLPQTIQPGSFYECAFGAAVGGNAGAQEINTASASGQDDDGDAVSGNAGATVTMIDAIPTLAVTKTAAPDVVPAPGGTVTFTVAVVNLSSATDPLTLTGLVDDVHGDLTGRGDCVLPQLVAPGAAYTCSFSANVLGGEGGAETDTVTAEAVDDEGTAAAAAGSATVSFSACVPVLDLSDETITGLRFEGACQTILAGPAYVVGPSGELTFQAGEIIVLEDGFVVEDGGRFTVWIAPP